MNKKFGCRGYGATDELIFDGYIKRMIRDFMGFQLGLRFFFFVSKYSAAVFYPAAIIVAGLAAVELTAARQKFARSK